MTDDLAGQLRALPSVDEVVLRLDGQYPRRVVVEEARRVIAALRHRIQQGRAIGDVPVEQLVAQALRRLASPSLTGVINATGVILHTNLGRAPLMDVEPVRGYSNLEYDIATGGRGRRDVHVGDLIERLVGRPGIVVNNNAAAVFLTLNELAAGGEVVISRGELIEIGDGFRIPDIMARSGAVLREVGTTNRTHMDDYRAALNERTRMILRVHPSNFHVTGFTGRPALRELAGLARERSVPLYEDRGSGCMVDLGRSGITESMVSDSIAGGVNVVSFSCDKLLGGPQAGIIAGDPALVTRIRRNPMFRAFRADKLIYQSLEATLRALLFEKFDQIPAIRMLLLPPEAIAERAERMCEALGPVCVEIISGESLAGGGSTPDQAIPTWLLAVEGDAVSIERKLRTGQPPVIARIANGRLLIDLRTVFPEQDGALVAALQALS